MPHREVRMAWVAGIVEGEGWLGIVQSARPRVTVTMADEDVIHRLQEWTGVGTVRGPIAPRPGQTKAIYSWNVARREEAAQLLRDLLPLLGERRAARAQEILAAHEVAPPRKGTEVECKWGHPFSGDNLITRETGHRRCRQCINDRAARYRANKRAA